MNNKNLFPAILLFTSVTSCNNNSTEAEKKEIVATDSIKANLRHISILADEALSLMDTNSAIEVIAEGYKWTEGPVYVSDSNYLIFSDVPANRIYKWKQGNRTSVYLEPSGYTGTIPKEKEPGSNGLVIDKKGKLVLCQQGNRQIGRMKSSFSDPKPQFETIVSNYKGKKFNSPNDPGICGEWKFIFYRSALWSGKGCKGQYKRNTFPGNLLRKTGRQVVAFYG